MTQETAWTRTRSGESRRRRRSGLPWAWRGRRRRKKQQLKSKKHEKKRAAKALVRRTSCDLIIPKTKNLGKWVPTSPLPSRCSSKLLRSTSTCNGIRSQLSTINHNHRTPLSLTMRCPSVSTRLTSLLRCEYPLVLPGMSWISTPPLVAAVSNAGGVGILATGPLNADQTRDAIRRIRELAPGKPFGIGATLLMPGATENAQVALEEQVPLVNVSLGKADWVAEGAHSYGGKVLATVTNAKLAQSALEAGADALMCTGHEAAAHGGDVTSLVLVRALATRFPDVPIVEAGGFADGRGLSAALTLGADAVAMGSRFAVSEESPLAAEVKRAVAVPDMDGGATESDTVYGKNFDGIHARVLKTPASVRLNARPASFPLVIYRAFKSAQSMNIPHWKVLPGLLTQWDKMYAVAQFGAATEALQAATVDGILGDEGVQFIGQSQGLIKDIPNVGTLVQRIMNEAKVAAGENASRFGGAGVDGDNYEDEELEEAQG